MVPWHPRAGACQAHATVHGPNLFLSADGGNSREAIGTGWKEEGSAAGGAPRASGPLHGLTYLCSGGCSGPIGSVPLSFDDGVLVVHTQVHGVVGQITPRS